MKQNIVSLSHRNVLNFFIVCELDTRPKKRISQGDCLFEAVKLTKTADPDKYGFIGYGIGIDARSQFPLPISE